MSAFLSMSGRREPDIALRHPNMRSFDAGHPAADAALNVPPAA